MDTYKVKAPIGTAIMPNDVMTEEQIRNFIPSITQDPAGIETWREKAAKDPIEDLIGVLTQAGFEITKQ